jgi:Domain of unknown function (DUF4440)
MAACNNGLFGAVLCSLALTPPRAAGDDAAQWFRTTTQSLYDAVAPGESAVWDRVLDAGCTITTEDGEVLDKAHFLEGMRPLPPGFSGRIKVRDLTVRNIGRAAVVHYWLDETEDIFGQQLRTTYVETDVYHRVAGSWKMVALQVTVVPRDLDPVPVNSADWPALVGDYRFADAATTHYEVRMRDGALYGGRDQKTATLLIPLAPLVFFQKGSIHIMVFVQDSSGAITEVRELHKYNEAVMRRVATLPQPSHPAPQGGL